MDNSDTSGADHNAGDTSNAARRARAIGGVFFRSADPEATRAWYQQHLGLGTDAYGSAFTWRPDSAPEQRGFTQWSSFEADTDYFGSADQQFMINYRVEGLAELVETLRAEGVEIVDEIDVQPYGSFVHIVDNDGRRVELWEPIDTEYEDAVEGRTTS